ncbi:MAG: hypothetical protein ABI039_14120 [Vicinamibacterales bacterium]
MDRHRSVLEPPTGCVTLLPPGLTMDMRGGWTADGRIVYYTQAIESALWRFRPAVAGGGAR